MELFEVKIQVLCTFNIRGLSFITRRENYMGHFVVKEHYMKLKKIIFYYFMIIGMIIENMKLRIVCIIFLMIIMKFF